MTTAVVLGCLLGLASPPPPASGVPSHPRAVDWTAEIMITAGAGLGYLATELASSGGDLPRACAPVSDVAPRCPESFVPFDRIALGHYRPTAARASDVLLGLAIAGPIAIHAVEVGLWSRRAVPTRAVVGRGLTDGFVFAEAILLTGFTINVLKQSVERPRPMAHLGVGNLPPDLREPELGRSFPSGHAGLSFAAVVTGATLLSLKVRADRGRPHRRRRALALGLTWGLGIGTATTVAALRVVAGKHYPSDVFVGAVVGSTYGATMPLLRSAFPRSGRLSVLPGATRDTFTISVRGRFG